MQADLDRWASQITETVRTDPTLTLAGWQSAVQGLRRDLDLLREKVTYLRDGREIVALGLEVPGPSGFEGLTRLGFAMGASALSNGASTVAYGLNATAPIAGASDGRIDFTFRNENDDPAKGAWSQWLNFRLRMAKGTVDLTPVQRVRLRLKADSARTVRLDLDSGRYKNPWSGVRFGWGNIRVGTTPVQVTLEMSALAIPSWAQSQGDVVSDIRAAVNGFIFSVDANGRQASGVFSPGGSDRGWLQVDDIEILAN
jgi:hypothetical protein